MILLCKRFLAASTIILLATPAYSETKISCHPALVKIFEENQYREVTVHPEGWPLWVTEYSSTDKDTNEGHSVHYFDSKGTYYRILRAGRVFPVKDKELDTGYDSKISKYVECCKPGNTCDEEKLGPAPRKVQGTSKAAH